MPYFANATQWIFVNADEAKYSFGANQFRDTGSWGYSGRKPGSALIVAAAQALLGNAAATAFYAEGLFGVLLVLVCFLLARYYIPPGLAVVAALAISSSLFFQYYTKTHVIFSSFWFALGVLFYLQSPEPAKPSKKLFLSGLSMGAGLSCYYNLEIYIPALILPEMVLWRQTGQLQFRRRGLYFLGGLALIPFCLDLYTVTYWLIFRRFSEPVTMSLFDHFKFNHVGGFNYPWDRFVSQLVVVEGKTVAVLFVVGLVILFHRVIRSCTAKDVLLLGMMVPLLLLQVRAWLGHLSVLRAMFSAFPFVMLIVFLPLGVGWHQISGRLWYPRGKHVLYLVTGVGLLWCSWRAYTAFQTLAMVSTGYDQVNQYLHQMQAEKIAYWGNQFAWRYYLREKTTFELQTEGQPNTLRDGGVSLAEALQNYQWVVVNQAGLADLPWMDQNLSDAGFVFDKAFASNEFDFPLVRQEDFADNFASYDVLKEIQVYRRRPEG